MLEAIDTHDPSRGALTTWAAVRIRRRLQDLLHDLDPSVPTSGGRNAERKRQAKEPGASAADLGVDPATFDRWRTSRRFESFERLAEVAEVGHDPCRAETRNAMRLGEFAGEATPTPEALAAHTEELERAYVAVGALTRAQKKALERMLRTGRPDRTARVVVEAMRRALA
jgi:hypothetical protein